MGLVQTCTYVLFSLVEISIKALILGCYLVHIYTLLKNIEAQMTPPAGTKSVMAFPYVPAETKMDILCAYCTKVN